VQLIRFQSEQLPDSHALLATAAQDAHPRVRMAAINVAAQLRANGDLHAVHAITGIVSSEPAVRQMLEDLKAGTTPAKGRSVPVLNVAPESEVMQWIFVGETGSVEQKAYPTAADIENGKTVSIKTKTYRTFIDADNAQTALLTVNHGYLDISVNGVQLLTVETPYSAQQQVQLDLQKGLNLVEIAYRRVKSTPPPVFIYDPLGQPLTNAHFAVEQTAPTASASAWEKAHAADTDALRVQAVPNLMQLRQRNFTPKPAGRRIIDLTIAILDLRHLVERHPQFH
jgi:hypothetical protein